MWTVYRQLITGAARQMVRYRLRSGLAISCAALGASGVITSVDYAASGRQQILDGIQRMGINTITVTAQQSSAIAGRARTGSIVTTLREADYAVLRRDVSTRVRSSAIVRQPLRLKAGGFSKVVTVVGCEPAYFAIKSWRVADGDTFDAADVRRSARVAVVGHTVAVDLFGEEQPVGQRLLIDRVPFEVVGELTERGQGLDMVDEDNQVYVPLTTSTRRLLNVDYFSAILFEIADWSEMDASAREITDILRVRHRALAGQQEDFQVQNQKSLVDSQVATSARLTYLVRWIGITGLVVSGLGVLAIAWIGVRDRTREIGTRRALGATAADVFFQFAFEAFALALLGAASGLALGFEATRIVAARARLPFVFDHTAAMTAFLTALLLNLAFAAWPSYRAARLDPSVALRHE